MAVVVIIIPMSKTINAAMTDMIDIPEVPFHRSKRNLKNLVLLVEGPFIRFFICRITPLFFFCLP